LKNRVYIPLSVYCNKVLSLPQSLLAIYTPNCTVHHSLTYIPLYNPPTTSVILCRGGETQSFPARLVSGPGCIAHLHFCHKLISHQKDKNKFILGKLQNGSINRKMYTCKTPYFMYGLIFLASLDLSLPLKVWRDVRHVGVCKNGFHNIITY